MADVEAEYEEFLKKCTRLDPLLHPTLKASCMGYATPDGIRLHDIQIRPYFDSRTIKARNTDIVVSSYPGCGLIWVQEICYLILRSTTYEGKYAANRHSVFLEFPKDVTVGIEELSNPRLFITHLPYSEIPPDFHSIGNKIVYVTRNPKDTVLAHHKYMRNVDFVAYRGDFPTFMNLFINNQLLYTSFPDHVLEFWKHRDDENVLFLTFESLQKDFKKGISQLATFLLKGITPQELQRILDLCNAIGFTDRTENIAGGEFVGDDETITNEKVGVWKDQFSDILSRKMDAYIDKHFQGSGMTFEYTI